MYKYLIGLLLYPTWLSPTYAQDSKDSGYFSVGEKRIPIAELNRKIDSILQETDIPGLSLAVISDGKVVYSHGYGYKELGEPAKVDDNTVFEGCSLSKSFLVYVAYRLVDKGLLNLDTPLYRFSPNADLAYDPRYKLITARMVLNHSSGLENWKEMNDPNKLELIYDPGVRFSYSGEGYQYLAKVCEALLHEPYKKYIRSMVYRPLKLKRTFSNYRSNGKYPDDYAMGYDVYGKKMHKLKNSKPIPAAGNHFIAADYARLIVATFDGKHLSQARIRDILEPRVSLKEYSSVPYYYGQGYELQFKDGDTIISQGGNNPGFKAEVFYSTVSRNGIVFMANSDRGKWIAEKLSAMTVGLDVHSFFEHAYHGYPSATIRLLKVYDDDNANDMFEQIDTMRSRKELPEYALSELGDIFKTNNVYMARRLLEMNTGFYPDSSRSYYLLGIIDMHLNNYGSALGEFTKAKELQSKETDIEARLSKCREELAKLKKS